MARKLKTFITSIGFYDLAIAAPSMKAALDAWGSSQNLFHQGMAEETEDSDIVAATLAQPGVVLRRPVGSKGAYKEKPDAPKELPINAPGRATPTKAKSNTKQKTPAKARKPETEKADKAAILSFEKAKAKRDAARKKQEAREAAQRKKDQARIARAVAKADAALERAKARHDDIIAAISGEREKLDRRATAERDRWDAEREKLEEAREKATD